MQVELQFLYRNTGTDIVQKFVPKPSIDSGNTMNTQESENFARFTLRLGKCYPMFRNFAEFNLEMQCSKTFSLTISISLTCSIL